MTAPRDARRRWTLFRMARELPESEREEFLRRACGDDHELFDELVRLVQSSAPEDFLASAAASPAPDLRHDQDDDPLLGARLDDFTLESVLGRGGMGTVYRARESGALDRLVAIKVVRRGVDTDQVLQRFHAEQTTLARLNHPALAAVHRAGSTPDGRPWFAMEFVPGRPLTEFCKAGDVSLRRRLALFIELCSAVQYIHQKGFIHRDLKPSNILVRDEDGAIKLIDFGIARALESAPDARLTQHTPSPGTPAYMSPEQLDENSDPDTRSDVYALGVVLYELLTGELPFGALQGPALSEAVRTRDPQTPSRRLAEPDNPVAALHPGWRGRLKGDFDWIVMKALARERDRRYSSAAALAEDLERALEHRPVMARPPARSYLVGRFVRRHPVAVTASLIGITALGVLSVLLWLRGEALQAALDQAVAERQRAEQISAFMLETFSAADPNENPGAELTARALLDQGRERLAEAGLEAPVRAQLLLTIANTYRRLGEFEAAQQTAEQALREIGERQERSDLELRAEILTSLTTVTRDRSNFAASADYARQALVARTRLFGENSLPVASSTAGLGYALLKLGRFDDAEPLLERAVAMHRELGADSDEIVPFDQLASLYVDRGRFEEAEALYRQALERTRRIHGANHPDTATRENNLATLYYRTGQLEDAARHYEQALEIQRRLLDPLHPNVLTVMNNLGALYNRIGDWNRAVELLEPALSGRREVLGEDHLEVAVTGFHLANALARLERAQEAESNYLQAIETMRQAAGPRDRRVGVLLNGLAEFQLEQGDATAAVESVGEALDINLDAWPDGHRTTAQSRLIAARVELALGRPETAAKLADEAFANFDQAPGQELAAAVSAATLALALHDLGRIERVGILRDRALAGLKDQPRYRELVARLNAMEHAR